MKSLEVVRNANPESIFISKAGIKNNISGVIQGSWYSMQMTNEMDLYVKVPHAKRFSLEKPTDTGISYQVSYDGINWMQAYWSVSNGFINSFGHPIIAPMWWALTVLPNLAKENV